MDGCVTFSFGRAGRVRGDALFVPMIRMRRSSRLAAKAVEDAAKALENLTIKPKQSRTKRAKEPPAPLLSPEAAAIRDAIFKTPCEAVYDARYAPKAPQAAPIAVIVAGPAGAGKTTTYASVLPAWFLKEAQYANVDVYSEHFMAVHDLFEALPAADRKALNLAAVRRGAICTAADLKRWMAERRHLVIDKPCDKADEARALVRSLRAAGYDVYMLVVTADKATVLARNRGRTRQVPDDVVEAIWEGVEHNLVKGVYAGLFKEAPGHLVTVHNDGDGAAAAVAEAKKIWVSMFPRPS